MMKLTNVLIIFALVFLFDSVSIAQDISKKITVNNDLEIVQLTSSVYMHISYAEFAGFGRVACNGMILTVVIKRFCLIPRQQNN